MEMDDLNEVVIQAMGEASALFMSQDVPGTQIVMPGDDLLRIGDNILDAVRTRIATLEAEVGKRDECIRSAHYWLREMHDDSQGGTHARRILWNQLIATAEKSVATPTPEEPTDE